MENSSKNVRTSHAQKVSMEIFQELQETILQNITPGFSSNFRKQCLKISPRNFSNIISGRLISKSYVWKLFKDVRTSHVQKIFMEICQTFQETKFQSIIHGFFQTYQEVMFEHLPVDFSQISGHKI